MEHGHGYETQLRESQHNISLLALMVAFFLHALLDGVILSNPSSMHGHHHGHGADGLLIGILLHKVPESFVLASILNRLVHQKRAIVMYLFIFALASPLGLLGSGYCDQQQWLSGNAALALWGVC